MKKVLFISVTRYNLARDLHLKEKFEGLSRGAKIYVLARGKPFHQSIWGAEFYLLPQFFFWPLAFFTGFYLCLSQKIETIVAQSPLMEGCLGAILKKTLKKELIVEIHGDWVTGPFLSKKRKLAFIQKKFVPFLAKLSLKNADKIRAVAGYLLDEAKKIVFNKKQYFIFPTFTDLDVFLQEQDIKFDNFILFVGHLQKVKGVDYLIEAFAKIRADFLDFKLVLIGQGTEKLNASGYIELRGRLSSEQTRAIMKDCYCLVLPSLSEGLPRVILEAMALSKPVIASRVGGIPDLIHDGQNGFLFEVGNADELAKKLRILLGDKEMASAMGQQGREFVQARFSNAKYVSNYLQMINL